MKKFLLLLLLCILPVCSNYASNLNKRRHIVTSEEHCKAMAIYKEARGESIVGQRAVYDVVVNRMAARGLTACQVVFQKGQFPWAANIKHFGVTQSMLDRLEVIETFVPPAVPRNTMYFNNTRFIKIGKFHKKIGKHYFYVENI